MFTFAIRPGNNTEELLIEFRKGSGSDEMILAMKKVLAEANADVIEKIDLWQNDEVIYKMKSQFGSFEISSDNYGCIFIMAPDNQPAIVAISSLLSKSNIFKSEAISFD